MTDTDDMIVMEEGDVVITAASELVDSSYRAGEEFLWGYYFRIENNSDEKITLLGKNWNITDDSGRSFCDDSDGFSGEIPELEPGEYAKKLVEYLGDTDKVLEMARADYEKGEY